MSTTDLLQTQVGLESAWADGAAPTARLMGIETFAIKPEIEGKALVDQRGSKAPGHISEIAKVGASASYDGFLTYEEIHYFLESMVSQVTPSGVGPYVYDGEAPGTALETPRNQNFVHGGPNGAYGFAGGVGKELTIAIATGEEGRFSGELIGKQSGPDALETLSDRDVTPIMGDHAKIYIDAWAGTMGATEMANLAFSAELSLETNRELSHRLSALTAPGYAGTKWAGSLKMVMEFDATTIKAFVDTILAASPVIWEKQVRIECISGANLLDLDFAGFQEEAPEIFTDENGVSTVEFNLIGQYNATLANWFKYSGTIVPAVLP